MHKISTLLVVLFLFTSCAKNTVFSEYKSIPDAKWHKNNVIKFSFNTIDTISKQTIYVNLRNNKDYEFSNIYLIIGVDFPNGTQVKDTLEYKMADEFGYFLGQGFTDIKENKLEFKTNTLFPIKGNYQFSIQQAMRKNGHENGVLILDGITDVGLSIEKMK
ncbi:MAG: gliding motility lipoprotein GldH [Flavobacteriaceae bacterium]